ncbi:HAMP domain-containing methyl-accepting chemotaxis protein [Sporosarcina sp. FSL W7-1349]|uniref:methyl-accepting chemotaxis protein n=1 Tax=Sporosarcina sp. FSL W7-1349 TaxID=2921561 RepID=UPI0030FA01CC
MSIAKKIYGGFGLLLAILLMFGGYSVYQSNKTSGEYEEMFDVRVVQSQLAEAIQKEMAMQGLFIRAHILQGDPESLNNLREHQQLLKDTVRQLSADVNSEEMKSYLEEIETNITRFDQSAEQVVALVKAGDVANAQRLMNGDAQAANTAISEASGKMVAYQANLLAEDRIAMEQNAASAKRGMFISILVDISLGLVIATFIGRSISRPVKILAQEAAIISSGDLTSEDLQVKSRDELRDLADAFNTMKRNLHTVIQNVNDNALHVTSAAEELSASTENVSKASQEVTVNMEHISASVAVASKAAKESSAAMEETAVGVQRITEAAQELNRHAAEAEMLAGNSETSVQSAKDQMAVIHESSNEMSVQIQQLSRQIVEIENITRVITDITEQTNLLALNAAIEAARAGEHGKGFAVVADEVRKLAEQSKASASQIVQLTTAIQQDTKNVELAVDISLHNVEEGVGVIDEAGRAFSSIASAIRHMSGQIIDISAATEELSASAEEVTASVQEIADQAASSSSQAEQNTAAVEEQMATLEEINLVAHSLSQQALQLQQAIREFKI